MVTALAVGLAGAVGAVLRYLLDGWVQSRSSGSFPFGTLAVNVTGSLVLGLLSGLALASGLDRHVAVVLGAGLCGGLTTWSTASWETVRLAEKGAPLLALRYLVTSLALCFAAAGLGMALTL